MLTRTRSQTWATLIRDLRQLLFHQASLEMKEDKKLVTLIFFDLLASPKADRLFKNNKYPVFLKVLVEKLDELEQIGGLSSKEVHYYIDKIFYRRGLYREGDQPWRKRKIIKETIIDFANDVLLLNVPYDLSNLIVEFTGSKEF